MRKEKLFLNFFEAVKNGNLKEFKNLLSKQNSSFNFAKLDEGSELLSKACNITALQGARKDNIEIVKLLLEHGANANTGSQNNSPLMEYCRSFSVTRDMLELFKQNGADLNSIDRSGQTPLITLAYKPEPLNLDCLRFFVENGADVNLAKHGQPTPLIILVRRGNEAGVKLLLDSNANTDAEFENMTAFGQVCKYGSLNMIKEFIAHGAVVRSNDLIHACQNENFGKKLFQIFIDKDMLANADLTEALSALLRTQSSANLKEKREIVEFLIKNGADINKKSKITGNTPFFDLSKSPLVNDDMLNLFLNNGADVNEKDENGEIFALKLISKYNFNINVVRDMIARGLNEKNVSKTLNNLLFNLTDPVKISKVPELKYVKTPVELIELLIDHSGESIEVNTVLKYVCKLPSPDVYLVEKLCKKGANPNYYVDDYKTTILHSACDHNALNIHPDLIKALLENGADVNVVTDGIVTGYTPLQLLCKGEIPKTTEEKQHSAKENVVLAAKMLLQRGADVNATTKKLIKEPDGFHRVFEDSPLLLACQNKNTNIELAKLLVESGADVNAENTDGITALGYACLNKNLDLIKYLLTNGADITAGKFNAANIANKYGVNLQKIKKELLSETEDGKKKGGRDSGDQGQQQ